MKKLSSFQRLLVAFILFIAAMLLSRIIYSGSMRFIFLLWNLFLAWVPYRLSLFLSAKKTGNNWLTGFLLLCWLLFFPNALYIITDLVHLEENTGMPVWYDAILIFTAAIAGLLMAFASLYKVEVFLRMYISRTAITRLTLLCLFTASFGVYLGRFLRWNSWDVITSPVDLAKDIAVRFVFPIEYYHTWAVTILLTALFCLLYFAGKQLTMQQTLRGMEGDHEDRNYLNSSR